VVETAGQAAEAAAGEACGCSGVKGRLTPGTLAFSSERPGTNAVFDLSGIVLTCVNQERRWPA
jgi:hypothetical protein